LPRNAAASGRCRPSCERSTSSSQLTVLEEILEPLTEWTTTCADLEKKAMGLPGPWQLTDAGGAGASGAVAGLAPPVALTAPDAP